MSAKNCLSFHKNCIAGQLHINYRKNILSPHFPQPTNHSAQKSTYLWRYVRFSAPGSFYFLLLSGVSQQSQCTNWSWHLQHSLGRFNVQFNYSARTWNFHFQTKTKLQPMANPDAAYKCQGARVMAWLPTVKIVLTWKNTAQITSFDGVHISLYLNIQGNSPLEASWMLWRHDQH